MVIFLRVYSTEVISGHQPEMACQTLKNKTIGSKAYRYRLERISRDRVFIARLSKTPIEVTTSLRRFLADDFFRSEKGALPAIWRPLI
jgi:hypothetical protein